MNPELNKLKKKQKQSFWTNLARPMRLHDKLLYLIWFFSPCVQISSGNIKGATSRRFRGFLAQTILHLVVANLIHSEHYL